MFTKGRRKTGGRSAGTPNARTIALRQRLNQIVERLDPEGLAEDVLKSKDLNLRWDVLRWSLEKLHGKPRQAIDTDVRIRAERLAALVGVDVAVLVAEAERLSAEAGGDDDA
jgi:hypothetical protein